MSGPAREMPLKQYVEQLPETHRARKEYYKLMFTLIDFLRKENMPDECECPKKPEPCWDVVSIRNLLN